MFRACQLSAYAVIQYSLSLSTRLLPIVAMLLPGPIGAAGRPPTQVIVATVEQRSLAARQWLPATVLSLQQATIAAEWPGRLLAVAEAGSHLARGEEMFRLDTKDMAQDRVVIAANIQREEALINFLDKETSRLQRLAKTNNAAQTQLEKTAADRDVARADLRAAQARLNQLDERMRRMHPGAPFAGMLMKRLKQPGEWAAVGDDIVQLADVEHLEIRTTVPLSRLPFLALGQRLDVEVSTEKGYRLQGQGQVSYLITAADVDSHRFTLRLTLPKGGQWAIGQVLRVAIPTNDARPVLTVPRDALVLRPAGNAVFRVDKEGKAERVAVETGAAVGDVIEVQGDLAIGDQVIVRGAERLRPGQVVHIARPAGAS